MKTSHVKASDVEERWYLYDASEHVLGRMAAQIAFQLQGKDRPTWTPSELSGAHVVVVNAEHAVVTGRKSEQKEYQTYSGYPGGRKVIPMQRMRDRKAEEIITLAVRRMLPKTKLGKRMLQRLKVYSGTDHPHTAQRPVAVEATVGTSQDS